MRMTRLIPRAGLALLLLPWGAFATADAQHAARPRMTVTPHVTPVVKPATKPDVKPEVKPHAAPPKAPPLPKGFSGLATALNTTTDALESAFETARTANPRLKLGAFLTANMLARDLGTQHPSITTQAILDGLKNHEKLGKILQDLGLSKSDARKALKTAKREIKRAEKPAPPEKPAKPEKPTPPEKPAKPTPPEKPAPPEKPVKPAAPPGE